MDGSRFDALTRRRFGVTTAGVIGAALGWSTALDGAAGKKRRRKRCRRVLQACRPGAQRKRCCKRLRCAEDGAGDHRCCRPVQAACQAESDCCNGRLCAVIAGRDAQNRCCGGGDTPCAGDLDCCAGFRCNEAMGTCGMLP